ncbi:Rap1a/Tai family immunity protein [Endozoicomonas gorgoniicola]|uniref:Rap1a/Tai family immunity protein n=1 Tax=Endozoicomonas gorgoniicola TaxID=1234144 RepID=A0ABT3N1L6_9GAMM|nr:Rap1a/Tai family immunity protein [Endozoicomonas gorgoniicola]MCW7555516.1 Rap1a/Tai family immunity protein [Endozoicomonas gorgoniicola]
MSRIFFWGSILLLLIQYSTVQASGYTGGEILSNCKALIKVYEEQDPDTDMLALYKANTCKTFIIATVGMNQYTQLKDPQSVHFCPPEQATITQFARILTKHLEANPNLLHEHITAIAVDAWGDEDAFICTMIEVGTKEAPPQFTRKTNNPYLPNILEMKRLRELNGEPKSAEVFLDNN